MRQVLVRRGRIVVDDVPAPLAEPGCVLVEVAYGVNTGVGQLSDVRIPPGQIRQLQVNLVRSHSAGVGEPLSEPEVRALMLLRANSLAKGFSGVRPQVIDTRGALNRAIWGQGTQAESLLVAAQSVT